MTRTIDDISKEIEEVAFQGEGADKLRALKMLREDRGGSAVSLPEPLADGEVIQRLGTMMRGCGRDLCHAAYAQAFPKAKTHVDDAPVIRPDQLDSETMSKVHNIRTLKQLYRNFPRLKRPGFPPGYPKGAGPIAQQEWCRRKAAQCLADIEQERARDASAESKFLRDLKDPATPIQVIPTAEPQDD